MSGDIGLEQPIIFYHKKMTEAKKIVLEHKGIKLAYLEKIEINNQERRWQGISRFSIRRKSIFRQTMKNLG